MTNELGAWLRQQREERGWSRPGMARRLITGARETGDHSMPDADVVGNYVYRWERGLIAVLSERYVLLYCRAFDIKPGEFGPQPEPLAEAGIARPTAAPPSGPEMRPCGLVAYRGRDAPETRQSTVRQEVLMAAHEGSDHAARAEEHGIGDATLEQLRADLARLSLDSDTGEPYSVFLDLRRVRERVYQILDRRLWPGEQADLYFMLGVLSTEQTAANLHLKYASASARLGDMDVASRAVLAAHEARANQQHDDLTEIGGEYALSDATHHYLAGSALAEISGTGSEIERAVALYTAGPNPGEQHWFGARALASIDLAVIRLRSGALDAAAATLEPALSLIPAQRILPVTDRLRLVRTELAAPLFRGSAQARDLDERIEEFGRDSVTTGPHAFPASPSA
jgi:transcriptional regulator with XRE-family HTH domain